MVSLLGLSGCFNGSSKNGDTAISLAKDGVDVFSTQLKTDEALQIDDADKLNSDISTLFGERDSEPVAVKDGDTVQGIIDRL